MRFLVNAKFKIIGKIMKKKTLHINHLAKIEGHASFYADLLNGDIRSARLRIEQGARLIEGLIVGRYFEEAPMVTSRICGICSVVHNLASIKALEEAFGVKINPAVNLLRKILGFSEVIQSHTAHVFYLSLGDFLGEKNDINIAKRYPRLNQKVIFIRDFANQIKEVIGGRTLHLIASVVGGFSKAPDLSLLKNLLEKSKEALDFSLELADFFIKLKFPNFYRDFIFVGMIPKDGYNFFEGQIKTSQKKIFKPKVFYTQIVERLRTENGQLLDLLKEARYGEKAYMVGALARLNLNHQKMNKLARSYLKYFPSLPCFNTYYNVLAQVLEIVHSLEEVNFLLKEYLNNFSRVSLRQKFSLRAGEGLGVVEAPRGTLYHKYQVDRYGIIRQCNIITPTAQFVPNIEEDFIKILKETKNFSEAERKKRIAWLIRAYDPCMTCAIQ